MKEEKKKAAKSCAKCQEYLDGWKRAKADYANLQKEAEDARARAAQCSKEILLAEIIPVLENFKMAFGHVAKEDRTKDWVVGLEHTKKQLEGLLKSSGIEPIETVGQEFDPELHEAVGTRQEEGQEAGAILEEAKGGYKMSEKTLIPAKVIVAE